MIDDAFAAELARLRDEYLGRLPEELSRITDLARKLEEGDRSVLEELHMSLHKIAGSGGTFGFAELSEKARMLERRCKVFMSGEEVGIPDFLSEISSLQAGLPQSSASDLPKSEAAEPDAVDERAARLWLVDDDDRSQNALPHLLEQFGYQVTFFRRFVDAESALSQDHPDLLIMGVSFAEEGLDATEEMLKRPAFKSMPCPTLFVSDRGDFLTRLRAVRMGAQGFLMKPLDVPRLAEQLEQIFEKRNPASCRVLIVDDDEALSAHYRLVLMAAGMEVDVLNRPEEVIERVYEFHPEIVLMDIHMGHCSGAELAAVIRQHDAWVGLPIVYLSAETDLDEQIRAMGVGADDFLTKPISNAQLVAAVKVRAARAKQLSDLMSKDSMTGLLKHSRIKEELALELSRAQRSGKPMSVVMTDIDHFKKVNDTYGHAVGDRVIRAVAHLLKQRLRKTDIIGRYGGEEFVAVLPECDAETALRIMDDIRERFSQLRFRQDETEFRCTLSAGVACNLESPTADPSELLVSADEALYQAKHGGRNQVRIAHGRPNHGR